MRAFIKLLRDFLVNNINLSVSGQAVRDVQLHLQKLCYCGFTFQKTVLQVKTKEEKLGQQWLKTQRSGTMETMHSSEIGL